MSKSKKDPAWTDCCEDWGSYMAAKKAKLEEQFQEAAKSEFSNASSLFNGIAIFVNGYTNPTADELKRIMMAHGGVYHHYLRPQGTTHLIASNLPYSKIIAYRKAKNPLPLCKPEWITDSIKAGKILDYRKYLLYTQCTEKQPALFAHVSKQKVEPQVTTVSSDPSSSTLVTCEPSSTAMKSELKLQTVTNPEVASAIANCTKNPEFLTEFYNNSRLHHISTMGAMFKDYINELRDKSDGNFPGLDSLKKNFCTKQTKSATLNKMNDSDSDEDLFDNQEDVTKTNAATTSCDKKKPVIMHIDMDCFFVSVGLRKHPELKGFPIAVAHAKGNKQNTHQDNDQECSSMSEVASCSYEARNAGVKNGMFLGQALKLCPNLKTIKYDFEGYKEVSHILYDTVASYTLDIEAVSCDEMYADCTKILETTGLSPLEFATVIRKEIKDKTGCPVSTGFGENKLQARLATKKAKPDGQCYLTGNDVRTFIRTLKVRDLPGVGYSTSHKLHQMNIQTNADLETISLYELQKEFGKKTGQQLYDMCRGIDHSKLNLEHIRKSISAEVNYGIRFENTEAAHEFLKKLCIEVSDRLKKNSMKGRCINLKVLFRAKDAPIEPKKFMGCGVCEAFNKSKNLVASTDDPIIITREVLCLWNQFNESPEEARGIGIQITKLESTKNKATGSTILKFIDKMKEQAKNEEIQDSTENTENFIAKEKKNNDLQIESNNIASKSVTEPVKHCSQLKQTKQPEYFKQIKPGSSNRSGKIKMPDIHEIDMKVLIELPEDIRNEILNEYAKKNENSDDGSHTVISNPSVENPIVEDLNNTNEISVSFSQVDPEFLAAIPDEFKCEVKSYCDAKKKGQNVQFQEKNNKLMSNKWNMFKNEKKPQINSKSKSGKLKVTKGTGKGIKKIDEVIEAKSTSSRNQIVQRTEVISEKIEKQKDGLNKVNSFNTIKENLEHSEILSSLVNRLLNLSTSKVKTQIEAWVHNNTEVNDVDFLSMATYLGTLPKKHRLDDLFCILRCLRRCIIENGSCNWHKTYKKIMKHVQTRMMLEYSYKIMVPDRIICYKCG